MEVIQIVLGIIIIGIGINLFIVVSNLSKKRRNDDENESGGSNAADKPELSVIGKILKTVGHTIAIMLMLAGIGYIVIQFFINSR